MNFEKILNRILDGVMIVLSLIVIGLWNFVIHIQLQKVGIAGAKYWAFSIAAFVISVFLFFPWDLFRKPMSEQDRQKYYRLM